MELKIGEKLPNGALVDNYVITPNGITVVAYKENDVYTPWVTWRLDESKNAYWGHYFVNWEEAYEDFKKRAI